MRPVSRQNQREPLHSRRFQLLRNGNRYKLLVSFIRVRFRQVVSVSRGFVKSRQVSSPVEGARFLTKPKKRALALASALESGFR